MLNHVIVAFETGFDDHVFTPSEKRSAVLQYCRAAVYWVAWVT
jgi:hypothetical protein